jgi:3-dehydroquinate synthase
VRETVTQLLHCDLIEKPVSYPILIKYGLLEQNHWTNGLDAYGNRFAIIADDSTAPLYGIKVQEKLSEIGLESRVFSFPSGEQSKTRQIKEKLENNLLEAGFGRDSCLIAIGGGVTTDLAGYLASTYCRGIPIVMIPTSLLAMVDASIGGKNGVNTAHGKNLIGTFHQPKMILIDPSTLKTLPIKELRNGFVEMLKHGLIADRSYIDELELNAVNLLELDRENIELAIWKSCRIKQQIVKEDEKETGRRRLLNFGHTIGHALEKLTAYTMPHGEAVAIGILVESYLSLLLGWMDEKSFLYIRNVFQSYDIPMRVPAVASPERMLTAMQSDKKSYRNSPRFALLKEAGIPIPFEGQYCTSIDEKYLLTALKWMNDALCSH